MIHILTLISVILFISVEFIGIYHIVNTIDYLIKENKKNNRTYLLYDEMIFNSIFDLENYLHYYINANPGLGRNYFIEQLESSTEITGKEAKELIGKGKAWKF